jgi:hypothetical protein
MLIRMWKTHKLCPDKKILLDFSTLVTLDTLAEGPELVEGLTLGTSYDPLRQSTLLRAFPRILL